MKSNFVIFLTFIFTFIKISHAQSQITAASFGADCPLAETKLSEDVSRLANNLKTHYLNTIADLKKNKEDVDKCFDNTKDAESFQQHLNLIKTVAENWAPKPVPLGLKLSTAEIKCSGRQTFISSMDVIFSQLRTGKLKSESMTGDKASKLISTFESCNSHTDEEEYEKCISGELGPNGKIGNLWESTCGPQFDITKNEILKKEIAKLNKDTLRNQTVEEGLKVAYKQFDSLLDKLTKDDSNSNNICTKDIKVSVSSGLTNIISAGSSLFSTMGPPLASLATLLVARPLNNLIEKIAAGHFKINKYQNSIAALDEPKESPFRIYSCALFAAQKARCSHDSELKSEICKPESQVDTVLMPIVEKLNEVEPIKEVSDENIDKIASLDKLLFEKSIGPDGQGVSVYSLLQDWQMKIHNMKIKGLDDKSISDNFTYSIASPLNDLMKSIMVFKNRLSGDHDPIFKPSLVGKIYKMPIEADKYNEGNYDSDRISKDDVENLIKVKEKMNNFKKVFEEYSNRKKTLTSGENNKLSELAYFKIVFDEMLKQKDSKEDKHSQNAVLLHKKLKDYSGNVSKLNQVLKSMMDNSDVQQIFENQWLDLSKRQKNPAKMSASNLNEILSQCMISLQFSTGKTSKSYNQACGFLKNSQCSDLFLIDFNNLTIPESESEDQNDYKGICRLNSSFDGILEKAAQEFLKKKTICGQRPEVLFSPK